MGDFRQAPAGAPIESAGSIICAGNRRKSSPALSRAEAHWQEAHAGTRERAFAIRLRGHGHKLEENHEAAIRCIPAKL